MLDFDEFYELHQESFHCHHDVLDEEDDGCHFWYCQKGIGVSPSSPDSRWRRCIFVNASLKSDRSFTGAFRPDVLRESTGLFVSQKLFGRHAIGEIFLRHLVHVDAYFFSSINSELRCTKFLNLSGSDREFLQNSFWCISFLGYGRWSVRFALQFSHDDCHEVAPSWWHSSGLREFPIAIGGYVGWIYSLSRDAHKCIKRCLDSNKEGLLSVAFWEMSRITQIALHCPCHESSSLIFH